MVAEMDFIALYQELGLTPGTCTLSEFKLAYRRRMQQLHPDRNPDPADDSEPESLQDLITVYRAAIAFERRFGRLPGAEPSNARRPSSTPQAGFATAHRTAAAIPLASNRWPWRRLIFASLVLFTLCWVLWGFGLLAF